MSHKRFRTDGRQTGSYPETGLWETSTSFSKALPEVNSRCPKPGILIALHSPYAILETGLRICHPEKSQPVDAIRSRAVRSLQSALRTKYYEIRASLRISRQKAGQFLCGLDLLAERLGFEPSLPFVFGAKSRWVRYMQRILHLPCLVRRIA